MTDKTLATIIITLFIGILIGALWTHAVTGNKWDCAAEDEVVIIGNTCVHIDTINNEKSY